MKRLYIIKIDERGYYKSDSRYQPVLKDKATKLDRKNVWAIKNSLKKLGYTNAVIEEI